MVKSSFYSSFYFGIFKTNRLLIKWYFIVKSYTSSFFKRYYFFMVVSCNSFECQIVKNELNFILFKQSFFLQCQHSITYPLSVCTSVMCYFPCQGKNVSLGYLTIIFFICINIVAMTLAQNILIGRLMNLTLCGKVATSAYPLIYVGQLISFSHFTCFYVRFNLSLHKIINIIYHQACFKY